MGLFDRIFGSGTAVTEIDVAGVSRAMQDPLVQIVDCRTEREWMSGHLANARLMPLGSMGPHLKELDPDRQVIVYCRSGHRSAMAARKLQKAGFPDTKSMKGGVNAWSRAGQTLVS